MKSKIELNHTSFLILIKDEEFFSRKLVNHINSQNVKAEFIIADGSKKKQKKIFDKLIPKKKYYYFGEDKDVITFLQKTNKGINKCSKKFILFCDQDDLVNFKTVKKDEEFLLKNKNYSAVGSAVYNFIYIKNKIKVTKTLYGVYYFDFKSFFLKYFFNINFRSYYYLHRKKNLKKIKSLIKKYKMKDVRSVMFMQDFLTLTFGRIKYHNDTLALRWVGVKKRDGQKIKSHFINQSFKDRNAWYKYFFSREKILINKILNDNKIFFSNFFMFKIFFFIFDITVNVFKRNIGYRLLIRIIDKISNKLNDNDQVKIYKKLKLDQIIKQKDLYK